MTRVPSWCLKTCQRNWKYGDLLWQQWDYPIMDKAGLDLTLVKLGKMLPVPKIHMCSYWTMNHFLKLQHSSCPHRPAGAWNAVTRGTIKFFLFNYWIQQNYHDLTSFLFWSKNWVHHTGKGPQMKKGGGRGSEFRDQGPAEGDRMQLPGVSSRCWRPWSMSSSGLFALNMWRRCNSWENPVFVADRAWDLATLLWHITQ